MPAYRAMTRTPYAIMARFAVRGSAPETTILSHRKELRVAIEYCRWLTLDWLKLIGGQPSPLTWYVIDTRDGTEHHPFGWSRKDGQRVQANPEAGTLW